MEQAGLLAARFPGSRIRPNAYGGVTMIYELDGVWHDAKLQEGVSLEAFVRTLDAPGVELTIDSAGRRLALPNHGDLGPTAGEIAEAITSLEASRSRADLRIHASDDPITALWLDEPAEQAVIAALYATTVSATFGIAAAVESFRYVLEDGAVWINRRASDPEHLVRSFVAATTLAARTHRIGAAWLDVARGLGGTTTADRWDLADRQGEFAVTIERNAAVVRIDNLRRLPGDDDDHHGLYTRARARRLAADGDRWAMWQPALPRAHRPKPGRGVHPFLVDGWDAVATDPVRLGARLRANRALLDAAAPSALATVDDAIELWWPGLEMSPARLGPAVELLARLAIEMDAAVGPYR